MQFKQGLILVVAIGAAGVGGYLIGSRPRSTPPSQVANDKTPANPEVPAIALPLDVALDGVPRDGIGFVSLKLSRVWDREEVQPIRDWLNPERLPGQMAAAQLGFPPADLDRVTGFWTWWAFNPDMTDYPLGLTFPYVLATTRAPYDRQAFQERFESREPPAFRKSIEIPIDRTTILLDQSHRVDFSGVNLPRQPLPPSVERLVRHETVGPLSPALEEAKTRAFVIGFNGARLNKVMNLLGLEPTALDGIKESKTITLSADLEDALVVRITVSFVNQAAAEAAKPALSVLLAGWAAELETKQKAAIGLESEPEVALYGWAAGVLRRLVVEVVENSLTATVRAPFDVSFRAAVSAFPKVMDMEIAQREAMNNLKQLGRAMHNHHDARGNLPGDVTFGNIQWSWRVQLLPYIEQHPLFSQLDMMKPWDDPNNKKVLETALMPNVFKHPGRPAPKGHTYFRVFSFPKGSKGLERPIFEEAQHIASFNSIVDGTSNTIMIVEAQEAVPWYQPDVLPYDGILPLPPLGAATGRKFLAAMADGSVRSFPQRLPEKKLRAYITRASDDNSEETKKDTVPNKK